MCDILQLISKGANINACSNKRDGGTPLHEAASAASSPDMINLLLMAGASPFVANTRGARPVPDVPTCHRCVAFPLLGRRHEHLF